MGSGTAWIESHQALQRHRKTIRAANLLKISRPLLIGHLHCFWWWALDNADSDGRLGQVSAAEIAEAAEWPIRQADRFLDALHDAGFVDIDADGSVRLHDWYDYAGKFNDRRSANAERMRAARSGRVPLKEVARDPARVEHVQRTFAARAPATQPNPTGPNHTGPEEDSPPPVVPPDSDAAGAANGTSRLVSSLVVLSDGARETVEFWRALHGKRSPPKLNPAQVDKLEKAVIEVGLEWLRFGAKWSAERGLPEFDKAINGAYTARQNAEKGSNGHGENRQRPGRAGPGQGRADAGPGAGQAGEDDPFAKYVISDEFPNGRDGSL